MGGRRDACDRRWWHGRVFPSKPTAHLWDDQLPGEGQRVVRFELNAQLGPSLLTKGGQSFCCRASGAWPLKNVRLLVLDGK